MGGHKSRNISGVSGLESLSDGRAIVVADLDNDRDEDFLMTPFRGHGHQLYRNNAGQANVGSEHRRKVPKVDTMPSVRSLSRGPRMAFSPGSSRGGNAYRPQTDPRLVFGLGEKGLSEWL